MQPTIGILMLATRFPRILGDAGNAASWSFPVRIRIVDRATPERVVRERAEGLVDLFIDAGRALAAEGVAGITTTCGFLCLHQAAIAAALPVPFAGSSLLQVPMLARTLPAGRRVGILTASAASLGADHLRAVGIDPATPVAGLDAGSGFAQALLENRPDFDVAGALASMLAAGRELVARDPGIGAIVLECANMPPYARALADALRLPVYDWHSMLAWFAQGLAPRRFVAARAARADEAAAS